jgi:hypothetical protein
VTTRSDRPDLEAVASAVGEPLDERVLDGSADLAPVDVPGVSSTVVWRVRDESGAHPSEVYVGVWPDERMRLLTADQDAWADLIRATGARLTTPEHARAYVEAYLLITRGSMVIVRPIKSLDELRWRPGSDSEEAAKAALLASAPHLAPVATKSGDGFHIELAVVVDQRLQLNKFDVSSSGEIIDASYEVLAEDLPLPIAR